VAKRKLNLRPNWFKPCVLIMEELPESCWQGGC
jgi:hypothetical protein